MSCAVAHRYDLDPALPWLWCRPAATSLIRSLAWEIPYAAGATLKRQKREREIFLSFLKKEILLVACMQQDDSDLCKYFEMITALSLVNIHPHI